MVDFVYNTFRVYVYSIYDSILESTMIKIFVHGCSTCGQNAKDIRRVKKYADSIGEQVQLYNTKYQEDARYHHVHFMAQLGLDRSEYIPLVVTDEKVVKLRDF